MVRTVLHAEAAVVAEAVILGYMQKLKLWLGVEDLEEITCKAECSEKHGPWNVCANCAGSYVDSEENSDPYPELESVGNSSERTEVAAPEHVDEEASDKDNTNGYD